MLRCSADRGFADLSRNVVEIIDRNLYERSCDVRWWATGQRDRQCRHARASKTPISCVRQAAASPRSLRSYTVYLDLWVADRNGKVICNGRGDRYHSVIGQDDLEGRVVSQGDAHGDW